MPNDMQLVCSREAERLAQFLGEEAERVVLGAAAQEHAARAAIDRLLAARKAEPLGIERSAASTSSTNRLTGPILVILNGRASSTPSTS